MDVKPFQPTHVINHQTQKHTMREMPPMAPVEGAQTAPEVPITQKEQAAPAIPVEQKPVEESNADKERLIAAAKKERALRQRELKLQEREKSLSRWEEAEKLASQNKLEAVKRLGITYDDLTNLHLQQMGVEQEKKPELIAEETAKKVATTEIDALKAQIQEQQIQQGLLAVRNESIQMAQARPKDFEYINAYSQDGSHDMIVDIIADSHLNENSPYEKPLSTLEAMQEVEAFFERKAEKVAALEKFKAKFLPQNTEVQKPSGLVPEPNQKPQTLTHRATTTPVAPRSFTAAELRERAIKRFYGQQVD